MDMLSFATGLAIGKKKYGGGGGTSIFQEMLNESTEVGEYVIDNTYKYTIQVWLNDKMELPNHQLSGETIEYDWDYSAAVPPVGYSFYHTHFKSLDFFSVAWEDDTPLFGVLNNSAERFEVYWNMTTRNYNTTCVDAYFYTMRDYILDTTSISNYGTGIMQFTESKYPACIYFASAGSANVKMLRYNTVDRADLSQIPEIYLESVANYSANFPSYISLFFAS